MISKEQRRWQLDGYLLMPGILGGCSYFGLISRVGLSSQVCRLALALALGRGLGRDHLSRGDSRGNLAEILINLLNQLEGILHWLRSLRTTLGETRIVRGLTENDGGFHRKLGSQGR